MSELEPSAHLLLRTISRIMHQQQSKLISLCATSNYLHLTYLWICRCGQVFYKAMLDDQKLRNAKVIIVGLLVFFDLQVSDC